LTRLPKGGAELAPEGTSIGNSRDLPVLEGRQEKGEGARLLEESTCEKGRNLAPQTGVKCKELSLKKRDRMGQGKKVVKEPKRKGVHDLLSTKAINSRVKWVPHGRTRISNHNCQKKGNASSLKMFRGEIAIKGGKEGSRYMVWVRRRRPAIELGLTLMTENCVTQGPGGGREGGETWDLWSHLGDHTWKKERETAPVLGRQGSPSRKGYGQRTDGAGSSRERRGKSHHRGPWEFPGNYWQKGTRGHRF